MIKTSFLLQEITSILVAEGVSSDKILKNFWPSIQNFYIVCTSIHLFPSLRMIKGLSSEEQNKESQSINTLYVEIYSG